MAFLTFLLPQLRAQNIAQAELAKLHATERAKLALREFEEEAAWRAQIWPEIRGEHQRAPRRGDEPHDETAAEGAPHGVADLTGSDHENGGGAREGSRKPGRVRAKRGGSGNGGVLLSWRALVPTPAQHSTTSTRSSGKKKKPRMLCDGDAIDCLHTDETTQAV